jgi:GntR family transcriptional regulator
MVSDEGLSPLKSARPLHDLVHDRLLELIHEGTLAPGQKLPAEVDLSRQLGVSRASLREALQRLAMEGYIARKRGIGTFVVGPKPFLMDAGIERLSSLTDIIASRGFEPGTSECTISVEAADAGSADRLGVPAGESVTVVERVRTADGRPFCYDRSVFPARYMPPDTGPAEVGESLLQYVEERLGLYISHCIARLIPERSDAFLSKKLGVPNGTLMLKLDEVNFLSDNTPVWCSDEYFPRETLTWHVVRTR